MKKALLLPILTLLLVTACEKENITTDTNATDQPAKVETKQDIKSVPTPPAGTPVEDRGSNKVTICHHSIEDNSWHVIQVNVNALPAHLAHGDVQLVDADGDGWVAAENECVPGGDCNDNDASVHAPQQYYVDADGDGYGSTTTAMLCSSTAPTGYSNDNTDCNDDEASVHPGAEEVPGNGLDDDCDPNTPDVCPEIEGLLLVTLPDGSCMYVHPTDNSIQWGEVGTDIPTLANITTITQANADFDGEANTQKIVDALGAGTYAAKLCADLVYNGYDDWYLPAAGELNAMYQQLGPYGSGQITTDEFYWSSSEIDSYYAWVHWFYTNNQLGFFKNNVFQCRCVRR